MSSPNSLDYVPLETFNRTGVPTGGDSLTEDLNVWYQVCFRAPHQPFLASPFLGVWVTFCSLPI